MRFESIEDAIGNTPLVRLTRLSKGLRARVYAKLEYMNPGGSVKDRVGRSILDGAEKSGRLKPGGTVIECTSGNTGMGLALCAAHRGYRTLFTINDKQSREKIDMMKAMGAEVIVCPTAVPPEDPRHYVPTAKKLAQEIPGAYLANQYDNPDNPRAHYETTGPEIWRDTDGQVTHFVCGIGTCGTIIGVGRFLKEKNPKVKIIGVDPEGSIFYDYFHKGKITQGQVYKVEGIGEDFFPKVLDWNVIDDVVRVSDGECFRWARRLAREEGMFAGGSSGGAAAVALRTAKDLGPEDLVVTLFPDGGRQYLNKIYNDDWMRENRFLEPEVTMSLGEILATKAARDLVTVRPADSALMALHLMREKDISQIPVFDGGEPVGTLNEDDLVTLALQGKALGQVVVREVMREPLPVLKRDATLEELTHYIPGRYPAVLVDMGDGRFEIIAKYDLVRAVGAAIDTT